MYTKLIKILCLIGIASLLISCQAAQVTTNNAAESTSITDQDVNLPSPDDPITPTIESLEEYYAFVNSTKLPDDFVNYDQIKPLGEFSVFVFTGYQETGDNEDYMYGLIDGNNEFSLGIEPISKENAVSSSSILSVSSEVNDLLAYKSNTAGYIQIGDVYYYYLSGGDLYWIRWYDETHCYTLTDLTKYQIPSSPTTVSRLLNRDTANVAFTEIQTALKGSVTD